MMIYNQAQLNMLTREMAALDKEMQMLKSENVRMSSQLTHTNSDIELERMAVELGMEKRTEYQTKRIYLYAEDKITRAEIAREPTGFEAAKLALMSLLSQFKEYPGAA
jgi:transcription initiation factor TFIIIB Brf1 subunit/transcription initiation factor TFIIB